MDSNTLVLFEKQIRRRKSNTDEWRCRISQTIFTASSGKSEKRNEYHKKHHNPPKSMCITNHVEREGAYL